MLNEISSYAKILKGSIERRLGVSIGRQMFTLVDQKDRKSG